MPHTESTFSTSAGATIYYQVWQADQPRAVILLAHGLAEHSGRYATFAEFFNRAGFTVAALDHPGHGRSDGRPGFIDRFDDYLDVLEQFRGIIAETSPALPMILLGHSMGGLVAACYLLRAQQHFCACVLSGPAIKSDAEPPAWQVVLLRGIASIAPTMGAMKLDATAVSRDPEVVRDYMADPLVYTGKISARQAVELFGAMQHIEQNAARITLPLLVMHGGEDTLTAPEGSRCLCQWVSSTDRELKIFPGLYHEIFNEPERETVMQAMLEWCEARLP